MAPGFIFQICNSIALVGWIILIVISPFWLTVDKLLIGVIITLFAIVYIWLITQSFKPGDFEKFGSLNGVMELFTNKTAVTAGWVHHLAFDLMTGLWIKINSLRHNISHWLNIPCLLLTFMLGPAGLILYLLVRWGKTKQYFAENYN